MGDWCGSLANLNGSFIPDENGGSCCNPLSLHTCNNAAVPAQQNNAAVPAQQNSAAFLAQQDRVQAVWWALQRRSASIAMLLSHIALHSQQDIMRVNVSGQKNTEHSFGNTVGQSMVGRCKECPAWSEWRERERRRSPGWCGHCKVWMLSYSSRIRYCEDDILFTF